MTTTMICPRCGAQDGAPDSQFCPFCGTTLPTGAAGAGMRPTLATSCAPVLERNSTNVIARAEAVRDHIYDLLTLACRSDGLDAQVIKSPPYSPSVWVRFDCWVRRPGHTHVTDRSAAVVTIRPMQFYRFECEMDVVIYDGDRPKPRNYGKLIEFGPDEAVALVRYLVRRTTKRPTFVRCREHWYQLWRPANHLSRLRQDWAAVLALVSFVLGIVTIPFGIGILLIAAPLIWLALRRSFVMSSGRPPQEPRTLILLDSWQALLYGVGLECGRVRAAIQAELDRARPQGMRWEDERIWHVGVDGKEERTQTVATFRRAIGFVHVYVYGDDLYVGWDAHVNCGTWVEKTIGQGIDADSGVLCKANTIEAGWHVPSEYDLTDANCLIEWIHAAVTKVSRRVLEEHRIDQEIDFKIEQRGTRSDIVGRRDPNEKRVKTFVSRFLRVS